MTNKKFAYSLAVIFLTSMSNITHATSITSTSVDWSTFKITANGNDVTNSIDWSSQFDLAETEYKEGRTGTIVNNDHSIDPNENWASNQNTSDGSIAKADTTLSNSTVSAVSMVDYTGSANSSVIRHGEFIADAATYTFSLDYSLSAEVNSTNTELGGGNFSPFSTPYVELLIINETVLNDPDRLEINDNGSNAFTFIFDDTIDVSNVFDSDTNSGSLIATEYFSTDLFDFLDGDVITIDVTLGADSRNFSSISAPVPLPSAILFLATGCGFLFSFKRLKKQG